MTHYRQLWADSCDCLSFSKIHELEIFTGCMDPNSFGLGKEDSVVKREPQGPRGHSH
jgi:hypothetical protein